MEANKNIFTVIKTEAEKIAIIIENTLNMLSNRIYIDKNGNKQQLLDPLEAKKTIEDRGDNTFIIKASNGDKYAVKIVFQRITATGKQSVISEFFKDYAAFKKILVAYDFNNKIADYVTRRHTQIFRESALLHDIIKYKDQPSFELLTPAEMEMFKTEYNVTDYTTEKMQRSDAMTRYFALRKGDIVRIIRPSPTSGEAIAYRIVQ